jgi:hypothetical protein
MDLPRAILIGRALPAGDTVRVVTYNDGDPTDQRGVLIARNLWDHMTDDTKAVYLSGGTVRELANPAPDRRAVFNAWAAAMQDEILDIIAQVRYGRINVDNSQELSWLAARFHRLGYGLNNVVRGYPLTGMPSIAGEVDLEALDNIEDGW